METNDRYSKHYRLSGFGEAGQTRLQRSSVLIIGVGGLGCPALQYLVAAGVGKIGIIDHDRIELSNLQRQVLFGTAEIGLSKTEVAAAKLRMLNPEIEIQEHVLYLSTENAIELIEGYDVVLDCTDNFATRYLLSDCCMLLDKPLVFGAIYRYEGQLAVFNVADGGGVKTTYRHLFPLPPGPLDAPDCNEVGVLGVLPGIIGTMQATEAIKLLVGVGQPLCNKLMTISLLDNRSMVLDIPPTLPEEASFPTSLSAFEAFDYGYHCGIKGPVVRGISPREFMEIYRDEDVLIVDVRNADELPELSFNHVNIPVAELSDNLGKMDRKQLLLVCQSGKRSLIAGQFLKEKIGSHQKLSHLEGGITALALMVSP
ncbi:molybdenum cofactor biosynthesis protein MoeB [Parapedobacter pyrenivorans]|uniref:Molybdopterin-synthase adenylyltransferase n=1 Tax=Parapedobacter pyrenivorans TaxID=1305674 RepID=A0A917HCJ7_9SPHI|nr:HesA/MoeB/ThiF family protein [Parapedobacter pyrenivorans]GGG74890.1 molybdenum cofactor biosynthesis protein MoeB [Parapedobacter pyrenivorans]